MNAANAKHFSANPPAKAVARLGVDVPDVVISITMTDGPGETQLPGTRPRLFDNRVNRIQAHPQCVTETGHNDNNYSLGLRKSMEERSAGAVLFFQKAESAGRKYLLLLNIGRWDFPKGNMEKGESEEQTAMREVGEETGLKDVRMVDGFRKAIEYFYRRDGATVHKKVVFYLARTGDEDVKISDEHQGFGWFTYDEALMKTTHDNSRRVLKEAEKFVKGDGRAAAKT